MKKIVLLLSVFLISTQMFSQNFNVPEGYKLEVKEDYARYEQSVIDGVDWLLTTPLTKDRAKRKEVNAFLMKWMMGSPNVMIELSQDIVTFMDCADCLMLFMGGWAKYSIETKDYKNKVKGNTAGIEAVIDFYKKNKASMGKNKAIEKYMKIQEKGELVKYIKSKT